MDIIQENIKKALKQGFTSDQLCFAYARVSTEQQATRGNSKKDQEIAARNYAHANGLHIVNVYSAAESAWKENRVEFNRMLDDVVRLGIRHIIFKNSDRLSRNNIDWPRCKKLVRSGHLSIHLYELSIVFTVDSTAEEEYFLDNTSVMARYWSNKIFQSVKSAHKMRAEVRKVAHRCPMRYRFNHEKKCHEFDPDTEHIARELFDLYDDKGYSLNEVASILNGKGYKGRDGSCFYKTTVHRILQN